MILSPPAQKAAKRLIELGVDTSESSAIMQVVIEAMDDVVAAEYGDIHATTDLPSVADPGLPGPCRKIIDQTTAELLGLPGVDRSLDWAIRRILSGCVIDAKAWGVQDERESRAIPTSPQGITWDNEPPASITFDGRTIHRLEFVAQTAASQTVSSSKLIAIKLAEDIWVELARGVERWREPDDSVHTYPVAPESRIESAVGRHAVQKTEGQR